MGRLRALVLQAQQIEATRDATAQKIVLHVAPPRECNTQHVPVRAVNDDAFPDPAADARRLRVLAMLEANPPARYALVTDTEAEPETVILTLAIRGRATCELAIPRAKYDPWLLLDLIELRGGTIH